MRPVSECVPGTKNTPVLFLTQEGPCLTIILPGAPCCSRCFSFETLRARSTSGVAHRVIVRVSGTQLANVTVMELSWATERFLDASGGSCSFSVRPFWTGSAGLRVYLVGEGVYGAGSALGCSIDECASRARLIWNTVS